MNSSSLLGLPWRTRLAKRAGLSVRSSRDLAAEARRQLGQDRTFRCSKLVHLRAMRSRGPALETFHEVDDIAHATTGPRAHVAAIVPF